MPKATSQSQQYLTRTGNYSTRISRRGFDPDAPDQYVACEDKLMRALGHAVLEVLAERDPIRLRLEARASEMLSEWAAISDLRDSPHGWKKNPERCALAAEVDAIATRQGEVNAAIRQLNLRGIRAGLELQTLAAERKALGERRHRLQARLAQLRPQDSRNSIKRRKQVQEFAARIGMKVEGAKNAHGA